MHRVGATHVEAIGVVCSFRVALFVVNVDVVYGETMRTENAEGLHGRVLDAETVDEAVLHVVGGEELGLLLPLVALAVPPTLTLAIEQVAAGPIHSDAVAGNGDERSFPFLVPEGCLARKGHGCTGLEFGQVQRLARRNGHVLDGNGLAALLLPQLVEVGKDTVVRTSVRVHLTLAEWARVHGRSTRGDGIDGRH